MTGADRAARSSNTAIQNDEELERLTQRYGRALLAHMEDSMPRAYSRRWWQDLLTQAILTRPTLKAQLFRLVDVLPALEQPRAVVEHLRDYLREAGAEAPGWLRALPALGLHLAFCERLLARLAQRATRGLAHRFIVGSCVADILPALVELHRQGLGFTLDLLGEAVRTETEAEHYREAYLNLLAELCPVFAPPASQQPAVLGREVMPPVNVSLKLSALYSQFDPADPEGTTAAVLGRLRPILRRARQSGAFVYVDMEQYAYKDLTLHIFRRVLQEDEFSSWRHVGIALQAYLPDTEQDIYDLLEWTRQRQTCVWVRLVKGAYWDYERVIAAQNNWPSPVFAQKWQTDAQFERLTRLVMQHRHWLRPAIASHNVRSLAHALAIADLYGIAPWEWEVQMLYGMAEPLQKALQAAGCQIRIYTPVGEALPGMAYLVRRLLENTANQSFLRASLLEHESEEVLLMRPESRGHEENRSAGLTHAGAAVHDRTADMPQARHREGPLEELAPFRNEPPADFSRRQVQRAMRRALEELLRQVPVRVPMWIVGQPRFGSSWQVARNPSHASKALGEWCAASGQEVAEALATATAAFPAWRDTPVAERVALLLRAADAMRRQRFALAAWEVLECGKPWREADADVAEAIDYCEYYAREMLRLSVPRKRHVPGERNEYFYEPRGVAVVIAPWNFPLAILCGMTTAALVTGNTVIMKPAESATLVGAQLMGIFAEVGFPAGVVQFLPGRGEDIGPLLVGDPRVSLIAFTGSRSVGLAINRLAAEVAPDQEQVKRVIAEMGGKNAIIVDDDADLDEAVHGVVVSAFGYAGQKCSACSRVIVLPGVYDSFVRRLVEATRSLRIGPAEDPGTFLGPVISEEARERIHRYIEIGKTEASLIYAGSVAELEQEGYYVAPHIFEDVPPTATIAQEEIFGPVLALLRARTFEEAVELANATRYALTGGVYSRSPSHIRYAEKHYRVGNLYINRKITGALVDRQPFGGFKMSGIGSKAGGPDYLLQFVWPRTVTENTVRHGFAPELETVPLGESPA